MIEKIKQLESIALQLEPNAAKRAQMRLAVVDYAESFLDNIEAGKAYQVTQDKGIQLLDFPVTEQGRSIQQLIDLIEYNVDRPGLNPASGGHIAYIPGGGMPEQALYIRRLTESPSEMNAAQAQTLVVENSFRLAT